MSTNKHVDVVCLLAVLCAFLLMLVFLCGDALGIEASEKAAGYEARLFNTEVVHTIDIEMDDWDGFLETCENEEYSACSVVIDGESYRNVGLRVKGNSSLSNVSAMNSDRYSFKIEFDQYDNTKSYYGLDKLSLNNLIQDNTCMKDYMTYRLMGEFGVSAPLCSYVYITVNGEDWGLYLAVEGVEDAFLERNYGSDHGELYKPDSSDMGGGRGAGKDFAMDEFLEQNAGEADGENWIRQPRTEAPAEGEDGETAEAPARDHFGGMGGDAAGMDRFGGAGGGMDHFGGMGSEDVKLLYVDEDPDSYANIFDNAKTDITKADQTRLIAALKTLSSDNAAEAVDVEQVIRYFVVHNFVVNGDSYTGSLVHNYYLYEEDGKLSMIPWDYNLAFGSFQSNSVSNAVNDPIDTPLSVTGSGDRPMIDWIFSSEEYTRLYHQYFSEFLDQTDLTALIQKTVQLIAPYVEKDPTKFCTYEEFQTAVQALERFCELRVESVRGQLAGEIPGTSAGQAADSAGLVDVGDLNLSDTGNMGMGGGFNKGDRWKEPGAEADFGANAALPDMPTDRQMTDQMPPGQMQTPEFADPEFAPQKTTGRQQAAGENAAPAVGQTPDGGAETNGAEAWIVLGAAVLVLAVGLLIAWKFQGKRSAVG